MIEGRLDLFLNHRLDNGPFKTLLDQKDKVPSRHIHIDFHLFKGICCMLPGFFRDSRSFLSGLQNNIVGL